MDSIDISPKTSELTESAFNENLLSELPSKELKQFNTKTEEINLSPVTEEEESNKSEEIILTPSVVSPQLADASEEITPTVASIEAITPASTEENRQIEVEHITTTKQYFQYKFLQQQAVPIR